MQLVNDSYLNAVVMFLQPEPDLITYPARFPSTACLMMPLVFMVTTVSSQSRIRRCGWQCARPCHQLTRLQQTEKSKKASSRNRLSYGLLDLLVQLGLLLVSTSGQSLSRQLTLMDTLCTYQVMVGIKAERPMTMHCLQQQIVNTGTTTCIIFVCCLAATPQH